MVKANKFLEICKKCEAKCCKMGGPNFTEKEMRSVLKEGYKNYFYKVRKGIYELKSKKAICPYLKKDNSCKIHKIKPLLCLCWPVFPKFKGKNKSYIIIDCPMTKILSKKEIKNCKKEASKVSKELIEVAFDYSTVSGSTAKLIDKRFKKFKVRNLK